MFLTNWSHRSALFSILLGFLFVLPCAWGQVSILSNRYDNARTAANLKETVLNTSNVTANKFGKLYSYPVDGGVYAQPLYVSGVTINGAVHNVLFVVTMNDKVYAFDADSNTPALWIRDFTNPPSVVPVPITDIVDPNLNIVGNVGVEGTPVIDPSSNTMYLVARTKENGAYLQRLHALDITSGLDRTGSPVVIQASVSGTAPDSIGGFVNFNPEMQNQRAGLALSNGVVLIAWGSHEDTTPFHGWVMGYDATTLNQVGVFCTSPDYYTGGVWQAGRPPVIDSAGNAYYLTGNGVWDGARNFGDSVIKLSVSRTKGFLLLDWFTPDDYDYLNTSDTDLGSSGLGLLGNTLSVGGGKEGVLYLLNTNNLGHEVMGNTQIPQIYALNGGMLKGGSAFWTSATAGPLVYIWAQKDVIRSFHFNGSTLDIPSYAQGALVSPGSPGGALSVSANGSTSGTGIVWASLSTSQSGNHGLVAGTLRAYNAETLQEIWDSDQDSARDQLGTLMKFVPPVVVNGKVYLPTYDNVVLVYGLQPVVAGSALSGALSTPAATQNLTTLGTSDWAHWGLTSSTSFDHKTGVTPQISNYAVVNGEAGMVANFSGGPVAFTWTDGTPDGAITGTATGAYISGTNRGFQIQVPADTNPRVLTVYVGVYAGQSQMLAHLSDFSLPDYLDTSLSSSGSQTGEYTFNYSAANSGQTLTITFTITSASGNVNLQAATLALAGNTQSTPDFTMTVGPSTQGVNPGGSTTYAATITPLNGFTGTVNLGVAGLPSNTTALFSPASITGTGSSTLTVTTLGSTPTGSSTLTITGTSGSLTHTGTVGLAVNSTTTSYGAISIKFVGSGTPMGSTETAGVVAKSNWNDANGASSTSPLSLADENGTATGATVTWTADNTWMTPIQDLPGNNRMMRGYLDNGKGDPSTVTVTGLSAGTYSIYVYGDGDNGSSAHTGIYQLSGPGMTTSSISMTDAANTNFSGTFTQGNNSNGNYVLFTGVTISSGFTLTATPGATPDYPRAPLNSIQIVPGTPSTPTPDFTMTVGPSTQGVNPGGSTTYTATITPLNGFTGTVNFAAGGLPAGASFLATPVSNASVTLSVGTAANTVPGSYPLLITATSGTLSHTASATFVVNGVPDFTASALPSSQTVSGSGSTSFTATIAPLYGFTGAVSLSVSGLPANASGSFTPSMVSNGTGSSTLNISVATNTTATSYPLTITATSGALSHAVSATLVVTSGSTVNPPVLNGSFSQPTTTQNLSTLGTSDWAHWGLVSSASFDHKAGVSSQITNYTVVNGQAGQVGAYSSNAIGYTWTGGTPDSTATSTTTGVYISGQNLGFQIQVPADTSSRTLTVYVGAYATQAKMVAHLSDSSAPDYVDTSFTASGSQIRAYTFNYSAAGSGQTLTITFTQSASGGNVNFQSAVLAAMGSGQSSPDFTVGLQPSSETVTAGSSASYTTTITPLNSFSGTVTAAVSGLPAGATFSPSTFTNGSNTLTITVPSNAVAGAYPLIVSGTNGALSHSANTTLVVNGIGAGAGQAGLSGSSFMPSGTVNLTALGTSDWAHWGLASSASFDHKAGVTSQISNYSVINAQLGSVGATPYSPVAFSWTDGTPTGSATATTTGVYVDGLNTGFQITVPADTSTRVVTVYVGINNTQGQMVAHLSDKSAPDYVDQSLQNNSALFAAYTFVYSAASPGQTLTLTWTAQQAVAYNSSVSLYAATSGVLNPAADFTVTGAPTVQDITPGSSTTYNLAIVPQAGFGAPVSLSVEGLPPGAGAVFSPATVTASGMPILTVNTQPSTPAGQYPLTITALTPGVSHSALVTLNVLNILQPYLGGSSSVPSAQVNLTAQGTADWAHWGLNSSVSFDHKAGVAQQISNYSVVVGQLGQVADGAVPLPVSWTVGTPDGVSSGTTTSVYITGLNTGYQVTVPADTAARILTLYVGVLNTQGKLTAHLSDFSALDYVDTALSSTGEIPGAYSLAYRAGSAGQTLTVTFTLNSLSGPRCSDTSGVHCSVLLEAATLVVLPPSFTLGLQPASVTVSPGNSATYTATILSLNGFNGAVNIAVNGLPTGATFSPPTMGNGSTALNVTAAANTAIGSYPLVITGTSGSLSQTVNATLVVAPADFTLALQPSSQTIPPGNSIGFTATVTPINGFNGTVSIGVSGLPAGAGFSPPTVSNGPNTLNVNVASNTAAAPYPLVITGTSGSLSHSVNATLVVTSVADFTLSVPSPSQSLSAGTSASYAASISPVNGFSGTASFVAGGLPSGASASFAPATVPGGSGSTVMTVNVTPTTPPASYPITLTATSGTISHTASLTLVVTAAGSGIQHYVSPNGSSSGDGSINNPWDLQTALNQPTSVQPGDTIWMRNGVYGSGTTEYTSSLNGTNTLPIIVRQYPGEHATVNGGITVNGSYTWYWGFEVTNLVGVNRNPGPNGPGLFQFGVDVLAPGTRFINLVVHDTAEGFSFWTPANNSQIYGSLIYNNGWQGTDRGQGHGIYTQNQNGVKVISDNIIFQGFGEGIQCYGSSAAFVQNYVFGGNTIFNSGSLSSGGDDYNLLVAGGPGPQNITVTNNYTFHTLTSATGLSSLSWQFDSQASNLVASNNYWIGGNPAIDVNNWNGATFTQNTAYSQTGYLLTAGNLTPSTYNWDHNTYYQGDFFAELNSSRQSFGAWQSATGLDPNSTLISGSPTGTWTFVRPNQYEIGRANITIYNWSLANSVPADVSGVLVVGQHFVVLNAQNFYGPPVVSGTYSGGTISIPMSNLTAAQAIGTGVPNQPQPAGPLFGAFVLLQQ